MSAAGLSPNIASLTGAEQVPATYSRPLPPIVSADDLLASPPEAPPEIIDGVLHKGSKLILGGASKSYKTWTLIDMAISVQAGVEWWGIRTFEAPVLYLNFEVQAHFFQKRIRQVSDAKGLTL